MPKGWNSSAGSDAGESQISPVTLQIGLFSTFSKMVH